MSDDEKIMRLAKALFPHACPFPFRTMSRDEWIATVIVDEHHYSRTLPSREEAIAWQHDMFEGMYRLPRSLAEVPE